MKIYVTEFIKKVKGINKENDYKMHILLLDLIHDDILIFNLLQNSQIQIWLRVHCYIVDYDGKNEKRELILQSRKDNNEFVSNMNIYSRIFIYIFIN
jgi:hypothetical protein